MLRTPSRLSASGGSSGAAPALRLRYNRNFLPEYLSTVLISLGVSWVFLHLAPRGARPPGQNPHAILAVGIYGFAIAWLVGRTFRHRRDYETVVLAAGDGGRIELHAGGRTTDISDSTAVEGLTTFFGRSTRCLRLHGPLGETCVVNEVLAGYDGLKRAVESVTGRPRAADPEVPPRQLERAAARWAARHAALPPPDGFDPLRLASRLFCLVPVAVLDFAASGALTIASDVHGQPDLAVYASPAALLASALMARYVYYYLFTNAALNRSPLS